MNSFKDKRIVYIAAAVGTLIICVIVFLVVDNNRDGEDFEDVQSNLLVAESENLNTTEEEKIFVYIVGEVNSPGVIEANDGVILKNIIELAGGFTPSANIEKVNLAYRVEDGQKIIIPSINDSIDDNEIPYVIAGAGDSIIDGNSQSQRVNINRASQTELETLSGIGPSMASKIIEYRTKNGKFKNIEDIKNVPGIGDAKFESIKDEIVT